MGNHEFQHVVKLLDRLEDHSTRPHPSEAEQLLKDVLERLFALDNYTLQTHVRVSSGRSIDFIAVPDNENDQQPKIGIEFKHFRSPAGVQIIQQTLGAAILSGLSSFMLVSTGGFSADAHAAIQNTHPVRLTLKSVQSLRQWAEQLQIADRTLDAMYDEAIRVLCERFALTVARNPDFLDHIEWRELEKMLTEVLSAIGLSVHLTPSSKDGGKDIIAECSYNGVKSVFYIEIKHWRCGNRVGVLPVRDFVQVIFRDNISKGLFLSSSGYADGAYEALTETEQRHVELGGKQEIIKLCKTYTRVRSGLWKPPKNLAEVLFSDQDFRKP